MKRVLVIDDESDLRAVIGAMLVQQGIQVQEARDGREGLLMARENPPDLILCDLTMPVMGGVETLAECHRDDALSSVPFVVITGMSQGADEEGLMQAGAAGIVFKPFTSHALLEKLEPHLRAAGADRGAVSARPMA